MYALHLATAVNLVWFCKHCINNKQTTTDVDKGFSIYLPFLVLAAQLQAGHSFRKHPGNRDPSDGNTTHTCNVEIFY